MSPKILVSTIVWGEKYVSNFINLSLKSLIQRGNLYKNIFSNESKYIIYCEKNFIDKIKNNRLFIFLKKHIFVELVEIDNIKFNELDKYKIVSNIQEKILNKAYLEKFDVFIFIYPDTVIAENHIKFCLEKIEQGYQAIACPGPLGILENFYSISKLKKFKFTNSNISRFILNNLHPFYKGISNYFDENTSILLHKEKDFQVYNCFHVHLAALNIKFIKKDNKIINSLDDDYIDNTNIDLDKIYFIKDSQESILITLEEEKSARGIFFSQKNLDNRKEIYVNLKKNLSSNLRSFREIFFFLKSQYIVKEIINLGDNLTYNSIQNNLIQTYKEIFEKKIKNNYEKKIFDNFFLNKEFKYKWIYENFNGKIKNHKYKHNIQIKAVVIKFFFANLLKLILRKIKF